MSVSNSFSSKEKYYLQESCKYQILIFNIKQRIRQNCYAQHKQTNIRYLSFPQSFTSVSNGTNNPFHHQKYAISLLFTRQWFLLSCSTHNDHSESEFDAHWLHMHRRDFERIQALQIISPPPLSYYSVYFSIQQYKMRFGFYVLISQILLPLKII